MSEQQQHDENKLIALRRDKLNELRSKRNPFPNDFRRKDFAADLQNEHGGKTKEELAGLDRQASVAGRIMAKRGPFLVLQDMTGRVQAYIDRKGLDKEQLKEIDTTRDVPTI